MRRFPYLALCLLTLASTVANADWFHDFDDGIPDTWEFWVPPPVANSDSTTWAVSGKSSYLQIGETRSIDDGGAGVISSGETSEVFTDVRVSGQVNVDSSVGTFMGLAVETVPSAGIGAYLFGFETAPSPDVGTVWLARGGGEGLVQWGSQRDYGIETRLDPKSSYYMQLEVLGNVVTGTVFDEADGVELIRISQVIDDPTPTPRYAGVYSDHAIGFSHLPTAGTFDNVSAVAIPEPNSLLLTIGGMPWLSLLRRRR